MIFSKEPSTHDTVPPSSDLPSPPLGLISSIQPFSLGDGPGIRTTVFFKGCGLHCGWCHNPETISIEKTLLFYRNLCTLCGKCTDICRYQALSIRDGKTEIDRTRCRHCGACARACPSEALVLVGQYQTVEDVMRVIRDDMDYYINSDGGVTLSGGEPMLQIDFCTALAKTCHEEGIHVLLDTAANVVPARFTPLLPYVDEYYIDFKAATEDAYQRHTGGSLALSMAAARYLTQQGRRVTARIPIIPGINDTEEHCRLLEERVLACGIKTVHLLPFHKLCISKYEAMGLPYTYRDVVPPTKEHMQKLKEAFSPAVEVSIKG